MRLSKVVELIHNSRNHQNMDKAQVLIHFKERIDLDDGNFEPIPSLDFTLTRFSFKDSSSK